MSLFFTTSSLLVFIVGLFGLILAASTAGKKAQFLRLRSWRKMLSNALLLNLIGFAVVCIIFENVYGFITDDVNYIRFPDGYVQPVLWRIKRGTEFMLFITYPFRVLLGFDRPSLHIMYACMGFAGSAIYFYAYSRDVDLKAKPHHKTYRLAFWCLLCFPNLIAWGRFFGKDSLVFTAAALFMFAARRLLTSAKIDLKAIIIAVISIYLIQMLRPHIAAALVAGLTSGLVMMQFTRNQTGQKKPKGILRIVVPTAAIGIMIMFGSYALTKLTGKEEVTLEDAQETIISSSRMGSYGGSATDLGAELDENPTLIFTPSRVALNIFNLYFAPMPWQIKGGYQIIAFISNMLLLWLFIKRWKYVKIKSAWAWFLLFTFAYLTIILSFMTGNIGLAMRQKIVVLPYIFMLLLNVDLSQVYRPVNKKNNKNSVIDRSTQQYSTPLLTSAQ